MEQTKVLQELKFSKFQALLSIMVPLSLYEPLMKMYLQAIRFHEYYWFIIILFVIQYVINNFIRATFLMIIGIPAICVTREDITLNQLGYTIEWEDIEEINLIVTGGRGRSYNLVIKVKEPWKYISQLKNPFTRYFRWYISSYYDPFKINLSVVEGDSNEIADTIENYFHKYRRAGV